MISIITAIYNQKSINRLHYESLIKNTTNNFELIIIDNNSNDGSREFFEQKENVKVINTNANYNYPYCQNLGIKIAKYDTLCFFNNDIVVTEDWDTKMFHILAQDQRIQVLSFASNDHVESKENQRKLARKWKKIKYAIQFLFGNNYTAFKLMLVFMYGNLNNYARKRFDKWKYQTNEGYSGSAIVIRKSFLSEIGLWDERIQSADFDLFNKVKELANLNKNILPIQLALGIYIHHFQRLTVKKPYPHFKNKDIMINLEEKWGNKTQTLRKDIVG
jgi:GT2 family glycosyltransferase